ncbi:MAG: SDR family NAD(P)-dependent oxidoreductase [Rivularia sp. (in: Bacteria)]|nr:SDR family NAD(P)-dependent oxidoreductase [Rivularia sp. MS3]
MNTSNNLKNIKADHVALRVANFEETLNWYNVSSGFGEINGLSADYPSYCLSKLALNGATIMLSQALRSENIAVNAMCPGWVKTDMGGDSAPRTPLQGADTAIWLATEASRNETGKYWRDRKVISY